MEYHIEIEEYAGQKVIHAYLSGIMSKTERNRAAAETIRKAVENNITRGIWDARDAKAAYSLISTHELIVNISQLGIPVGTFIAVIYANDKDQVEHARTVAHNRGITNIGYFLDLDEGVNWLISMG
jgi:hypothetical protein